MDGEPFLDIRSRFVVDRFTEQVKDPAKRLRADRHRNRGTGIDCVDTAAEPIGRAHRDAADDVAADMLGDFGDQRFALVLNMDRIQQIWQMVGVKPDIEDRSDDLNDLANIFLWHEYLLSYLVFLYQCRRYRGSNAIERRSHPRRSRSVPG